MNETVSFNMVVPSSEVDVLVQSLVRRGAAMEGVSYRYVPTTDEPGLLGHTDEDPFTMVMGQSLLPNLVQGLIEQSGNLQFGGMRINATGNQVCIMEDPDIEKGTIVIATLNGFKSYQPAAERNLKYNLLNDLTLFG
jgi:hypothetical protein